MRKRIIILFIIAFGLLFFYYLKKFNQVNEIDHLEYSLKKLKEFTSKSKNIYYYFFSNNKSVEYYYYVQFGLVPKVIIQNNYCDVPKDSCMIIVYDKKINGNDMFIDSVSRVSDIIFSDNTEFHSVMLLKKK